MEGGRKRRMEDGGDGLDGFRSRHREATLGAAASRKRENVTCFLCICVVFMFSCHCLCFRPAELRGGACGGGSAFGK